jgi:hypothetical protein
VTADYAPPPPSAGLPDAPVPRPVGDSCPICGAPLHPDQGWCLRCGAAARTRLAPASNSKAPMIAVALVAGLSLAVLAASLVKLAGDSGSTTTHVAAPVTRPGSVTSPGTATLAPARSTTTPPASVPVAVGAVGVAAVTTLTPSAATLNGTVNPQGVPTTYQFEYGTTASYGGRAPGSPAKLGPGASAVTVSARIAYLAPGTTYHYKLTTSKAGRTFSTADATFTTPPAPSIPGAGNTTPARTGASGRAP